ncbi:hypothetical protein NDU88_001422 [Pleurodeles waltl]|uniref:Uncharacterized protein n=1 Tax=Pleurodeles waltl TaxID=8319 RepID=A0AAV7P754_PLEWA|nr:hypothetical protein NDU88_001422 [Pleurodeles waltl]
MSRGIGKGHRHADHAPTNCEKRTFTWRRGNNRSSAHIHGGREYISRQVVDSLRVMRGWKIPRNEALPGEQDPHIRYKTVTSCVNTAEHSNFSRRAWCPHQ